MISSQGIHQDHIKVEIYNSTGALVKRVFTNNSGVYIDVSELPNGVYIVALKETSKVFAVSKLIIKK